MQEDKSATLATNNDQYLFQPVCLIDSIGGQAERGWEGDVAPCLKASHYKFPPVVSVPAAGFCTEHSAKARGVGYQKEVAPTLRAGVTAACVYAIENHPADSRVDIDESGKVQTLTSRMGTGGGNVPMVMEQVAYATDVGFFNTFEEQSPTLLARGYKDPHLVTYPEGVRYIVRRLTPTECARLQGFADRWGDIDQKDDFSNEEYRFWLEVRNTHAVINGKPVKEYTKTQMLTWYNKLHTDSSEYKMWGNGIALPPALYLMQGMMDALTEEGEDDWML